MRTFVAALLLAVLPSALAAPPQAPASAEPESGHASSTGDGEESEELGAARQAAWQQAEWARYAGMAQLPLPRDRAIAALQISLVEPAEFTTVLAEAAAAAPDDILVQWMAVHRLSRAAGDSRCGQRGPSLARAEHLVRLDVDNAAAHLPRLSRAWLDGDTAAVDSSIAAMAAARRHDSYYFDLVDANLKLWQQFPLDLPPLLAAEAEGVDMQSFDVVQSEAFASMVRPDYTALVRACDASSADLTVNVRRYAACGDIGRRMVTASTWIDRLIGYQVLSRSAQLTLEDAAKRSQLNALRKQMSALLSADAITQEAFSVKTKASLELRDEVAEAEVLVAHFAAQAAPVAKPED